MPVAATPAAAVDAAPRTADVEALAPAMVAVTATDKGTSVHASGIVIAVNTDRNAALVLTCSRGGQPVPMGWIYTVDDSGPRPLAGVGLDPDSLPITGVLDTSLTSVRITGSTVVTDWEVYVDGDARCCPAKTAVVVTDEESRAVERTVEALQESGASVTEVVWT